MGCEVSSFDGVAKNGETGAVRQSTIETSGRSSSTWMCSFVFVGSGSEVTTGTVYNAALMLSPIARREASRAHSASRHESVLPLDYPFEGLGNITTSTGDYTMASK